jgi:hypothetical protein
MLASDLTSCRIQTDHAVKAAAKAMCVCAGGQGATVKLTSLSCPRAKLRRSSCMMEIYVATHATNQHHMYTHMQPIDTCEIQMLT